MNILSYLAGLPAFTMAVDVLFLWLVWFHVGVIVDSVISGCAGTS